MDKLGRRRSIGAAEGGVADDRVRPVAAALGEPLGNRLHEQAVPAHRVEAARHGVGPPVESAAFDVEPLGLAAEQIPDQGILPVLRPKHDPLPGRAAGGRNGKSGLDAEEPLPRLHEGVGEAGDVAAPREHPLATCADEERTEPVLPRPPRRLTPHAELVRSTGTDRGIAHG